MVLKKLNTGSTFFSKSVLCEWCFLEKVQGVRDVYPKLLLIDYIALLRRAVHRFIGVRGVRLLELLLWLLIRRPVIRRLMLRPLVEEVYLLRIRELVLVAQVVVLLLRLCDLLEIVCGKPEILLDKLEVFLKSVDLRDDPLQVQLSPHVLLEPLQLALPSWWLLPHIS